MSKKVYEVGLTTALWDLFSQKGPQAGAVSALLKIAQIGAETKKRIEDAQRKGELYAWLPGRSPGPDLALISASRGTDAGGLAIGQLLAVFEIKAGARVSYPKSSTVEAMPWWHDANSQRVKEQAAVSPELNQIDVYRSVRWWRDEDEIADPIVIDDVAWIILDTVDHHVRDPFEDAVTRELWSRVSMRTFSSDLAELHLDEGEHQLLRNVLTWHLRYSPSSDNQKVQAPEALGMVHDAQDESFLDEVGLSREEATR